MTTDAFRKPGPASDPDAVDGFARRAPVRARIGRRIDQALGRIPADKVIRNTRFFDAISGALIDGDVAMGDGVIVGTQQRYDGVEEIDGRGKVVMPGFIDTHVHVESTLVTPFEFERCVLPRGTTTAICDPHEIANVLGVAGVQWFLDCAMGLRMDLQVQLSSCVPATELETAGARLDADALLALARHPRAGGLAEFMNYPGLFAKLPDVIDKLAAFEGRHVDGHAPLVRGRELNAYLACGICSCHETTGLDEGREKLAKGMSVLIREGTVSKDLAALTPLLGPRTSAALAFCTDDRNPLDIAEQGHLDYLIRRAIELGADPADVYRAATWSAARAFGLRDRGLVAPGHRADLVLLDDVDTCQVNTVWVGGQRVDADLLAGRVMPPPPGLDSIRRAPVQADDLVVHAVRASGPVIGVIPGSIVTEHRQATLPLRDGVRHADPAQDILKVCVLERHGRNGNIGRGFVQGFGLRQGALASSVGHDSHNLCVVGADDADMAVAVNRLITLGGGFVAVAGGQVLAELALPVAGLMSLQPHESVRERLIALRDAVRALGCPLPEPFLQLAFLPLPVIPHLKITDRGLVDVDRFCLIES